MEFDVRALRADHVMTRLIVHAKDEADARTQAELLGLFPSAVTPIRGSFLPTGSFSRRSKPFSLVLFSQELLALLSAGLSIVEGLEALLEKESGSASRDVLERLLGTLREGKRFSTALAEQSPLFPPLYVGIVRAAEGTSDLPRSLSRFIDYQQRIDGIRGKIVSASIYPLILLAVGGTVTVFLIGYVVPRFAEVYQGSGRNLPWMSELLLGWGKFAAAHMQGLLIGTATSLFVLVVAIRRVLAQGGAARLAARLPGVGERVRIYELSRLYLTLGMLLEGGIPIIPAMQAVSDVVSPGVRNSLFSAMEAIGGGTPLSVAFEANALATPISLRMLRVGERSGELGKMLTQSANFYDGEISRWIDRFTRAFEPLLMAAIGLVVGVIVVLLYMPIFDLAGSLS